MSRKVINKCQALRGWLAGHSILLMLLLGGCADVLPYTQLQGQTMGTYYRLQANCPEAPSAAVVEARLQSLNAVFSTYDATSELSQLNLKSPAGWTPVSRELMIVLQAAALVVGASAGAFDPTVGELVALWGFGPRDMAPGAAPAAEQIAQARARSGFSVVLLDPSVPAVRFGAPRIVDLSALAKGWAVDQLAALLDDLACDDYLVDIGGEVRVLGRNPKGSPWRLGIEQPGELAPDAEPLPVLQLTAGAVATSGDYRNYREIDGQRFSHLIDPRTGYPIRHSLASVTVWHPQTMLADAYATAISILGPEGGRALAERAKLSVAWLERGPQGFTTWTSAEFKARFLQVKIK